MIRRDRKTACPILDRLEKRYSAPHWVFLRELRNDTGFQSTRPADALAVGIYHSRGQHIVGFEKKVSRADWLRELKEPQKAEAIAQFCDQWFVVVPEVEIVGIGELPSTWGLLHVVGNKINTVQAAPKLSPRPIDRGMLAAIIERSIEQAIKPYQISEEEKRDAALSAEFERGMQAAARQYEHLAELKEQVKQFEEASGIHINQYGGGKELGEIVKAVQRHGRFMEDAARTVRNVLYELKERTIPTLDSSLSILTTSKEMVDRNPMEPNQQQCFVDEKNFSSPERQP